MNRAFVAAGLALSMAVFPLTARSAESSEVRQAREEVEREMQKMAGQTPPGRAKILWTGFDNEGVKADEADFELDGDPLPSPATENLAKPGAAPLQDGHLPDGAHKLSVSLVISHSNISLLRGYRIDRFKVNAQVPFHTAKGLEITIEVGLHVDTTQSEPKKMLTLKTSTKNAMLAAIDDSVPPPLVPPQPVSVDAGSIAPPPLPPVVIADAEPPPKEPDAQAGKPPTETGKHAAASRTRPAPAEKPEPDAGLNEATLDAGTALTLAEPAPIAMAALPPPQRPAPTIAPPPPPPPPPESDSGKRAAALVGALVLAGLAFAAGRSRRKS